MHRSNGWPYLDEKLKKNLGVPGTQLEKTVCVLTRGPNRPSDAVLPDRVLPAHTSTHIDTSAAKNKT